MWIGFLLNESSKDGDGATEATNAGEAIVNSEDKLDKEPEANGAKLFGIF